MRILLVLLILGLLALSGYFYFAPLYFEGYDDGDDFVQNDPKKEGVESTEPGMEKSVKAEDKEDSCGGETGHGKRC